MSNLIKYNYISINGNDRKIIDSNARTDTLLSALVKKEETEDVGFVEGIGGIPIERILVDQEELAEEKAESIIDEAQRKADEIINEANNTAQEINSTAVQEAQAIKQSAYDEGYKNAINEVNTLKQELEKQINNNREEYEKELSKLEPKVVEIMTDLIENITGIIVEDKKEVILHLVNQALSNTESNRFVIRVSRDDYDFLQENKDKISKSLSEKVQLEITEDIKLKQNQCMIETDSCVIDSSLDVQLKNLITELRIMSSNV